MFSIFHDYCNVSYYVACQKECSNFDCNFLYFALQPLSLSPGSPLSSPSKDKYGDRFIPARAGAAWHINFNLNTVGLIYFNFVFLSFFAKMLNFPLTMFFNFFFY